MGLIKNTTWYSFAIALLLCLFVADLAWAQTFVLQPTKTRDSEGNFNTKLLVKQDRTVRLDWSTLQNQGLDLSGRNAFLKIGTLPNNYNTTQIAVTGNRLDFTPNNRGLAPGRYYARITNASGNRMNTILDEFGANPNEIIYSNEIQIIVEAPTAAFAITPRGEVSDATPTFSWEPVPGAVGYWIILSSTPFQIEDNDGEIKITGVTGVWQYMTTETSATYGSIVSAFPDEPPPLNDGQEYSYTILNLYEEENPVYVSPVFGGIIPFRYRNPNALPRPVLQEPLNNEVLINVPEITFSWSEVPGATNYTVRLSKQLTQSGAEVSLPIWSTTTTNTLIDFNARGAMENTKYTWSVIANDDFGRGSTSINREFNYRIDTGKFEVYTRSSADGSEVTGVEIKTLAISGGATSSIAYLLQGGSVSDSLVAGTYEFQAVKSGFRDATATATIRRNETTFLTINMEPLPSGISGRVVEDNGEPSANATVETVNLITGARETVLTNNGGEFNQPLQPGSYSVVARKAGFIQTTARIYDLALGSQVNDTNDFVIQNDLATISGFVFNQSGNPIQLSRVVVSRGTTEFEALTNGQGFYSVNVSSGTWSVRAGKTGFVSPPPISATVRAGDNLQGQNFNLPAGANQVSGTIRRIVNNADGTTGLAPFANVQVTATPTVGNPITAVTGNNGQYSLSLTSGTYTMRIQREGFTQVGSASLTLNITETVSGLDFELSPNMSSVSGRVAGTDGAGLAGVTVSVPGVNPVQTTATGTYTLSVPEGRHEVSVFRSGFVSPSPQTLNVSPGQTITGINFTLSANAGVISGRVTSSGQALSGVEISSRSLTTNTVTTQNTDNEGRYTLSVRPGRYEVRATRSGFLPSRIDTVTVGAGQQLTNLNYPLTENTARISGTVTTSGTPVRNVRVTITSQSNPSNTQSTVTLVNGSYSFAVPAGSAYTIQTNIVGYGSQTSTTQQLTASQTPVQFNFSLTPNPASIAGTVRSQTGTTLNNTRVLIRSADGLTRIDSTTTGTGGTYNIGLSPGTYQVSAIRPGYTVESLQIPIEIGQNLSSIDFTLAENFAVVQGTITDGNGEPVEDVFVNLVGAQNRGSTATSDQNGGFFLSRLIGGAYTLQLSKEGYISVTRTVQVTDGGFVELQLQLIAATGSISGFVKDAVNEDPIPEADVTIFGASGSEFQTLADETGAYSVQLLPPDTYTIAATKPGFATPDVIEVELTPEVLVVDNADIANLIPNNAIISGVVRNVSGGASLQGVTVSVSGTEGSGSAITNSQGAFRIENLAPGNYSVSVRLDNFRSASADVSVGASEESTSDFELLRDNGRVFGRVTNQQGQPLAVIPEIVLSSAERQFRVRAASNGDFEITGLPTGVQYRIESSVFRSGYVNADESFMYPLGGESLERNVTVQVNEGRVSGNTGTSSTTVQLLNETTGALISTIQANAGGEFSFTFLPEGSYLLRFSKPGFVFQPAESTPIAVGFGQSVSFNTQAIPNIGDILVRTLTSEGAPLQAVTVRILGANGEISRTGNTNAQGEFRFTEVPADRSYTVSTTRTGYTGSPSTLQVEPGPGATSNANFTMLASNSSIAGRTQRAVNGERSNLGEVLVRIRNTQNGVVQQTTSAFDGVYQFPAIPSGTYELIASRSGFVADTLSLNVAPGQAIADINPGLEPSVFNILGGIFFRGQPVVGVTVTATSTNTFTTRTDELGLYYFIDLPLRTGAQDTTVYQVRYETPSTSYTRTARATRENLAQFVSVPNIILPSGQIIVNVTDGVAPLAGVSITFNRLGGSTTSAVTSTDGRFSSANTLRSSQYQVTYSRGGYLSPQTPLLITQPTDTTLTTVTARLPYRHTAVEEFRADEAKLIRVSFPEGYTPVNPQARLNYRLATQNTFTQVNMTQSGSGFEAEIPALFSVQDISYFVTVSDNNITYRSSDITRTPLASGILSNLRFTPSVDQQVLRTGDTYNIRLDISDGLNDSLNDEFGPDQEGDVLWALPEGLTATGTNGTQLSFSATAAGNYTIRVTLQYRGVELSRTQSITVVSDPINDINVRANIFRIRNNAPLLFSYVATDAQGRRQILGNSLNWSVEPAEAGSISNEGVFRASSDEYIGRVTIVVTDGQTGLVRKSDPITVFAEIRPNRAYSITDFKGMTLSIPQNSVTAPAELSYRIVQPEDVKKYVFLENTTESYITSDQIYRFNLTAPQFLQPTQLTLPMDDSHRFNEGEKVIARFDASDLVWRPFSTQNTNDNSTAADVRNMGQFSILAKTDPLDIKHLSVLPSPFSPEVAPLKIGYLLTTSAPPALVTIRVFNVRGELVRTILEDDLQQQGRYGSRAGLKEITWDGLTDSGSMARNGRYIIQVRVKDAEDEKVKLIPVVLVK